jgi:hypothetical protein
MHWHSLWGHTRLGSGTFRARLYASVTRAQRETPLARALLW